MGDTGVFSGGADGPIGHDSSFLASTAPTQRVNGVDITVETL